MLERVEKLARENVPPPPVAQLIGFRLTSVRSGEADVELEAETRHANPMGTLHGGILCDVADAAMGLAYVSTLSEGETFTTVDLKINVTGALLARGRVVKRGRTLGLVECDVTDEDGELVAKASGTCMTLRAEGPAV